MSDLDEERTSPLERRGGSGERRRYNRRSTSDGTPPYFEVFERIADALEGIHDELARGKGGPQDPGPTSSSPRRPGA